MIVDRSPVALARTVAVTIHEMLEDSEAYTGATEFLQSNPPPQDWVLPEDVDAWMEVLREATPYPAYSFHRVPTTGGADGTNHTVVNRYLQHARQEREEALARDRHRVPSLAGRLDVTSDAEPDPWLTYRRIFLTDRRDITSTPRFLDEFLCVPLEQHRLRHLSVCAVRLPPIRL